MNDLTRCFCGSGKAYSDCCEPLHAGKEIASTPEQLMRSRYAAFCTQNADYLIQTHHRSKRSSNDKTELEGNFASITWNGLTILRQQGTAEDTSGLVEFDARFTQNGVAGSLHETSRFIKEEGRWYYLDGEFKPAPAAAKLGRNDPCYCGSGKKFKKCHGA